MIALAIIKLIKDEKHKLNVNNILFSQFFLIKFDYYLKLI